MFLTTLTSNNKGVKDGFMPLPIYNTLAKRKYKYILTKRLFRANIKTIGG